MSKSGDKFMCHLKDAKEKEAPLYYIYLLKLYKLVDDKKINREMTFSELSRAIMGYASRPDILCLLHYLESKHILKFVKYDDLGTRKLFKVDADKLEEEIEGWKIFSLTLDYIKIIKNVLPK